LKTSTKDTLTKTVKNYEEYLPNYIPLPHPSPRNNIWQNKNEWFKENLIQVLQEKVESLISDNDLNIVNKLV